MSTLTPLRTNIARLMNENLKLEMIKQFGEGISTALLALLETFDFIDKIDLQDCDIVIPEVSEEKYNLFLAAFTQRNELLGNMLRDVRVRKARDGVRIDKVAQLVASSSSFFNSQPQQLTHTHLISHLVKLGYRFNEEGVCFGLSSMAIQAALLGEEQVIRFNRRLNLLASLTPDALVENVTQAREEVKKLGKAPPSEETRQWLEIQAFFDDLMFYQQPYHYRDWYEERKAPAQSLKQTAPLVLSTALEGQGGIREIGDFIGAYSKQELKDYFTSFQTSIENDQAITNPVSMQLKSSTHAISITWSPTIKHWLFADANKLPIQALFSPEDVASKVYLALKSQRDSINDTLIFETLIFTTITQETNVSQAISVWKKQDTWARMHQISAAKALLTDDSHATLLYFAAQNGYIEVVKELLNLGADINLAANDGASPLFIAAQNGHVKVVKELLNRGAKINQEKNTGETPLSIAVWAGHLKVVKELLNHGAKINQAKSNGETPLFIAAWAGHLKVVKELLKRGAKINQTTDDGETPLFMASEEGHIEVVKELLLWKADINQAMKNGGGPLFIAAQKGHIEVVELLLNSGARSDLVFKSSIGSLQQFARRENVETFMNEFIHAQTQSTNPDTEIQMTPEEIAIIMGHTEIATLLHGVNQQPSFGA